MAETVRVVVHGSAGLVLAVSYAAMVRGKESEHPVDERAPVLLVDDDPVIRTALREWLQADGYAVWEAEDGIDALYILDHAPTAVVLVTDYAMPRLDGRALIDFVAGSPELARRTAFIYITAGDRILSPAFAGDLVARDIPVLRKPFDLAALTRSVEQAQAGLLRTSRRTTVPPIGGEQ
jgi:CheY-like chemotaxis protein